MPIGLGVRDSFADIGASICEMLGVENKLCGKSFYKELSMTKERLCEMAKAAMQKSYSPYSHCKVGAALLAKSGKVYLGCNIENASYSATICAERGAFMQAVSVGARKFKAICIVGGFDKITDFCYPCGVCLQFMSEFCDKDFEIVLYNGKEIRVHTLGELLPYTFNKDQLK